MGECVRVEGVLDALCAVVAGAAFGDKLVTDGVSRDVVRGPREHGPLLERIQVLLQV